MKTEKKGELLGYSIGFLIGFVATIIVIVKMMETLAIQQEISRNMGIPIFDPFIIMFILFPLIPTLYFSGKIIKLLKETNRGQKRSVPN